MDEQQWTDYLALLAKHENTTLWACVGCWYEQHPAGVAFPGDRVSSTLCQRHLITLPGAVKHPESLVRRSYI
jgi:hypothetical protein